MPRGHYATPDAIAAAKADLIAGGLTGAEVMRRHGIGAPTLIRLRREIAAAPKTNGAPKGGDIVVRGIGADRHRAAGAVEPGLPATLTPGQTDVLIAGEIQADGLKERILRLVCEYGPIEDLDGLMDLLHARSVSANHHEVTHLLYSLSKRGMVTFRETKQGRGNGNHLVRIKPTGTAYKAMGYPPTGTEAGRGRTGGHAYFRADARAGDATDFRNQPDRAPGGPVTVIAGPRRQNERAPLPSDAMPYAGDAHADFIDASRRESGVDAMSVAPPEPVAPPPSAAIPPAPTIDTTYAILSDLRARRAAGAADRAKADALLEAAAALEAAGVADESERLAARAAEIASAHALSPIEAEYLTYAEEHP